MSFVYKNLLHNILYSFNSWEPLPSFFNSLAYDIAQTHRLFPIAPPHSFCGTKNCVHNFFLVKSNSASVTLADFFNIPTFRRLRGRSRCAVMKMLEIFRVEAVRREHVLELFNMKLGNKNSLTERESRALPGLSGRTSTAERQRRAVVLENVLNVNITAFIITFSSITQTTKPQPTGG